jgi:hypothetical protein
LLSQLSLDDHFCAAKQRFQGNLNLLGFYFQDGPAGQQDDVVASLYLWEQRADSGAQQPFRAIAFHGIPQGFSSGHAGSCFVGPIWQSNQNNKRMGIGFAITPHPLKVF